MKPTIPHWITGFAALFAVMALFISYGMLETETVSVAARNAIPAMLTIVTLIWFRSSVVAFIMIFVGRLTIEGSDLITGLLDSSSPEAAQVPMVAGIFIVEAVIVYLLIKKLNNGHD